MNARASIALCLRRQKSIFERKSFNLFCLRRQKNISFLYFQDAKRKIHFFQVAPTALGPPPLKSSQNLELDPLKIVEIQNGRLSVVKKQQKIRILAPMLYITFLEHNYNYNFGGRPITNHNNHNLCGGRKGRIGLISWTRSKFNEI